jgi:GNAT superfamily N-acetyltransferase
MRISRLSDANLSDFYRVHSPDCGTGWCYCVAWWVPTWEGWGDRPAEQNLALRDSLFNRGEYDGYLCYDEHDRPVGWAQVGLRDRLEKLVRQFNLEPDPEAWAVTCFLVLPHLRRRGIAQSFLQAILDDLRQRNVALVEAYPKRTSELDELELWMGPQEIFHRAGFIPAGDYPTRLRLVRTLR